MKYIITPNSTVNKLFLTVVLLVSFIVTNAQTIQLNVLGGANVTENSTITLNAGSSITFRITNSDGTLSSKNILHIQNVSINNTTDFQITSDANNFNERIFPWWGVFLNKSTNLDFTITNIGNDCAIVDLAEVTIQIKKIPNFKFNIEANKSPIISLFGGNPLADISNGSITTTATNGTFYGIIESGATTSVTRGFCIVNTGSCDLDVSSIVSSNSNYSIVVPETLPYSILKGEKLYFDVVFDIADGVTGEEISTISIASNDSASNPYVFNVSTEVFNYHIPGPGGVTADFRLWLKANRGVVESGGKVSEWKDRGTNGKHAKQDVSVNQPTYINDDASNINFNPVIHFENDGSSVEQFLFNTENGFYSQEVFIVMIPDESVTSSVGSSAVFTGVLDENVNDITGIGLGNYSNHLSNEIVSYTQGSTENGDFYGAGTTNSIDFSKANILNVRNNVVSSPTAQELYFNTNQITGLSTLGTFSNVGSTSGSTVLGTKYWLGKNYNGSGSFNGRIAEVLTFAEKITDADRQKLESYLGIKYGITLGGNEATKDYLDSSGNVIWDVSENVGFNYNVAGIGFDEESDLDQKQSKSSMDSNEVTIGLGVIASTNINNPNEFEKNHDFLVWGSNNGSFSYSATTILNIGNSISVNVDRIQRVWKINETGNVENEMVGISESVLNSNMPLGANEEYVLIVATEKDFNENEILDVIPLKEEPTNNGDANLQAWYDFDGTEYFTFGKTAKYETPGLVNIKNGDFLVGEYGLNLDYESFTVSSWIRRVDNSVGDRTIISKGEKLQIRLNDVHHIEVLLDDLTPKYESSMAISDLLWHHIAVVYRSGNIYVYIDGVLDKSIGDIKPPSPNFNRFTVGATFISEHNVKDYFLGEIDEVQVWNKGLSSAEVRFIMNQEIEEAADGSVTGKILPYDAISNEVADIQWSDLAAYYNFNTVFGTTIEGQADDRYFLRINYLKPISSSVLASQTAPIPYESKQDGIWGTTDIWKNGDVQNLPNWKSLGEDDSWGNTSWIDWNIVQINHNISTIYAEDDDIYLLGMEIAESGSFSMSGSTNADGTGTGNGLSISHYLKIDGLLDLEGESQLVQAEGSYLDPSSKGEMQRDQQGTANSYNYNYWSSYMGPSGTDLENPSYTLSDVLYDGNSKVDFKTPYASADGAPTIPATVSSYWLYTFYGPNDSYSSWNKINENSELKPGEGFTMKGTSGNANLGDRQNYVFKGLPYNGDITLELDKTSEEVDRLVGNPYPSALDADEFILDNMAIANGGNNENGNVFNGALYFWDHFGEKNSHTLREYVGGYATYNLMGGTPAISNDARIDNSDPANNISALAPGQYIPVGQGFFVITALDGMKDYDGNDIDTIHGGEIVFKNSQRVFRTEASGESTMLKVPSKKNIIAKNEVRESNEDVRSKIRLNFHSASGLHRQILIGTDDRCTENFDFGFDGLIADVGKEDMFWTIGNSKFVIQGVPMFNEHSEFPLGLIIEKEGKISIKVQEMQNIPNGFDVYIKDSLNGETYEITNEPFEIDLEPGEYLNRFLLAFQPRLRTIEEVTLQEGVTVFSNFEDSQIRVEKVVDTEINEINLFDVSGKLIKSWNSNLAGRHLFLPVNVNTGVYIVQVNTEIGAISKKVILK